MSKAFTEEEKAKIDETKKEIERRSVEKPEARGIGDMINFKQIFRLKGHQKVWTPMTEINKSGMITFAEWLNKVNVKTVHKDVCIRLGDYWFATTEMETIKIPIEKPEGKVIPKQDEPEFKEIERLKRLHLTDVFNNLNAEFIDADVEYNEKNPMIVAELMEVMCPNYDIGEFKPYHAKQVVKWYNEIKNKIIIIERIEELKNQDDESNT